MTSYFSESQKILQEAGIRPSIQRIAIYSYLKKNPIHPDIEKIYSDISPEYPTLSKTTVYNTLKLFEEKNIVRSVKIEDDKLRFDAEMKEHFHFKCNKCGNIYDIHHENPNQILKINEQCKKIVPENFSIEKIQTNIWGLCKNCQ